MAVQKKVKRRKRKDIVPKTCWFCDARMHHIDYRDVDTLVKFQTEKGRIVPRRISGICLKHQKQLSTAVKRARIISLVL